MLFFVQQIACQKSTDLLVDVDQQSYHEMEDIPGFFQSGFVEDLLDEDDELNKIMNSTGGGKIAGGQTAPKSKFKEYVNLRVFKGGSEYVCGGSIISSLWVLTAGHCLFE